MDAGDPPDATSDAIALALTRVRRGDRGAIASLWTVAYERLRALAARHRLHPDDLLRETTDLVHATFEVLNRQRAHDWHDPTHFLALASLAMRRIAVGWARQAVRNAARQRNGDDASSASPEIVDLVELEDSLARLHLEKPRCARVVEMRYFGGMDMEAIARCLGVSKRTVEGDWAFARAWLKRELRA